MRAQAWEGAGDQQNPTTLSPCLSCWGGDSNPTAARCSQHFLEDKTRIVVDLILASHFIVCVWCSQPQTHTFMSENQTLPRCFEHRVKEMPLNHTQSFPLRPQSASGAIGPWTSLWNRRVRLNHRAALGDILTLQRWYCCPRF